MENARLICDPPLGGIATIVVGSQIRFTVGVNALLEAAYDGMDRRVSDVVVWHNQDEDGAWREFPLDRLDVQPHGSDGKRAYFAGSLDRTSDRISGFHFTVKVRSGSGPWCWAKDASGLADGQVIFAPSRLPSDSLCVYLANMSSVVSTVTASERSDTCLCWALHVPVPAAQGQRSGYDGVAIGTVPGAIRWFALVRHNEPWFGPRHGRGPLALDREGILLALLRDDGVHVAVFALSGVEDVTVTFAANGDGRIVARCRNDRPTAGTARIFVAAGTAAHTALAAALNAAQAFVRAASPSAQMATCHSRPAPHVKRQLEDWYDGFAYCTWNGLGQHLTPGKIMGALDILSANGVRVPNLILDDTVQSLESGGGSSFYHRWTAFEANRENFPDGLKALTSSIRARHPYVRNIAIWHGIFGYWGGMSPTGQIARAYPMRTFKRRADVFLDGGEMTTVDGSAADALFDDFYRFLADSGVDAVKTDTQSFLDYAEHADDRAALTTPYQRAWRAAMSRHFDGKSIACMAQIPQTLAEFLREDGPRLMMRNSDDFFPDEPSSHAWHVFCNAHTALLSQHLNVLPDWDMFQTVHDFSRFHAAARCLSGGPIYITDSPGQHDGKLIEEMTAETPDGRLIILRPETVGRTAEIYVGNSEQRFLRVQTRHGDALMLGLFNVGSETLTELVHLGQFLGIADSGSSTAAYIVRRHGSAGLTGPSTSKAGDPVAEITVAEQGAEILTAHPVRVFGGTGVAVLGLLGKMTGAAAVITCEYRTEPSSTIQVHVSLMALGDLGIYVSTPKLQLGQVAVVAGGTQVEQASKHLKFSGQVLSIDLTEIWKVLGLIPCGREVSQVKVVVALPF